MIYGKATFLGVPWETIIRAFRDKRDPKARDHLSEYGAEFIEFIENWPEMFPPEAQQDYVARTIQTYFAYLLDRIAREIEATWQTHGPLTRSQGKTITREVIAAHHELWKGAPDADGGLAGKAADIRSKHVSQIKEARLEIFAKARISSASATKLSEIAGWLFTKHPPHGVHPDLSGVVVAGFGAEDYFPSLASYEFDGMVLGSIKYTKDRSVDIDRSADAAAIVPFAQRDSVRAFMEGIHPSANAAVAQEIDRLLMAYPEDVLEQAGISRQTRTKVLKAFAEQRDTEWDRITSVLTDHIRLCLDQAKALLQAGAESAVRRPKVRRSGMSTTTKKKQDPIYASLAQALDDLLPSLHEQQQKQFLRETACSWNVAASPLRRGSVLIEHRTAPASNSAA